MATARYNAHEDDGEITVPLRWFERVIKFYRVLQIRRQDWMEDREKEMTK